MFARPTSLQEAVQALAAEGSRVLAGGTDLYPALVDKPLTTPLVDLSRVRELRGIVVAEDAVRIGGCTTWTDIVRAELPRCFDGLKAAAREVGSVQIQNTGTIAGNLCNASPAADGVPALLALDAEVELASCAGLRRLPLSQFITGYRRTILRPGEILASVVVPLTIDEGRSVFVKLGARRYLVISIAMVAVILSEDDGRIADARIAVGACSPVALRLKGLEEDLIGRPLADDLPSLVTAAHLSALSPIDDARATAEYRRDAALTLVRRAIGQCAEAMRC